jgi:dUTP pyrophosphatase
MNAYSWLAERFKTYKVIPADEYVKKRKQAPKKTVKVVLDPGALMPARAHKADAGLDLHSTIDVIVYPGDSATINTGVHMEIPVGYVGMLKSKSGLNVKHNITSEGVIDSGYTGSICVKLYNHGNCAVSINRGQKISQLVLLPIITPDLELVESLEKTERGNGGFGSTGAF